MKKIAVYVEALDTDVNNDQPIVKFNLIKKEQDDELLNLAGLSNIICSLNSTKKGGEAKVRII